MPMFNNFLICSKFCNIYSSKTSSKNLENGSHRKVIVLNNLICVKSSNKCPMFNYSWEKDSK